MYRNLEAELKRYNITRKQLADALGINVATMSNKLTRYGRLKLCEAIKIQSTFFPGMTIEYLFESVEKQAA